MAVTSALVENNRFRLGLDLRSDALTQPTGTMWDAMRRARPGWATFGQDEYVNRIEKLACDVLGKEAALFASTGTMANLVALMAHSAGVGTVIAEHNAHIVRSERESVSLVKGVELIPLDGDDNGSVDVGAFAIALREVALHRESPSLLWVENTHTWANGSVMPIVKLDALYAAANDHSAVVHLDGARLFNAAVASGVSAERIAACADTVMVNINKGLSAPAGAILAGPQEIIARARRALKSIGAGSLHQAGLLAAAGIVALQQMIGRLHEDHEMARLLALMLGRIDHVALVRPPVTTNIVMIRIGARQNAKLLADRLSRLGVGVFVRDEATLRFVTHRHVERPHIEQVAAAVKVVADEGSATSDGTR